MTTNRKSSALARKIENSQDSHRKRGKVREAQTRHGQTKLGGYLRNMSFLEVLSR